MMDKKMPNSLEAEQYILANILISPKEVAAILSSVEPDDFYYDNHKIKQHKHCFWLSLHF